jgi:hypothetical protein
MEDMISMLKETLEELKSKTSVKELEQVRLDHVKFCVWLSYEFKKPLKTVFDDIEEGFNILDMPKQPIKKRIFRAFKKK